LQRNRHNAEFRVLSLVLARALDVAELRRVEAQIALAAARRDVRQVAQTTTENHLVA
jgi:hypothetical protein